MGLDNMLADCEFSYSSNELNRNIKATFFFVYLSKLEGIVWHFESYAFLPKVRLEEQYCSNNQNKQPVANS